jgi:hypothetical protein
MEPLLGKSRISGAKKDLQYHLLNFHLKRNVRGEFGVVGRLCGRMEKNGEVGESVGRRS